mgnify:CR=1 FL=1
MAETPRPPTTRRGRPPATDAATLQDAAYELFTLYGYEQTSIGDIAQLAGVSRNTFFNYFGGKTDVFWLQVDAALAMLPEALARTSRDLPPVAAIGEAVADCVASWDAGKVPWVMTQFDVIGAPARRRAAGATAAWRDSSTRPLCSPASRQHAWDAPNATSSRRSSEPRQPRASSRPRDPGRRPGLSADTCRHISCVRSLHSPMGSLLRRNRAKPEE